MTAAAASAGGGPRVAVLGAGIMGSCVALYLAEHGLAVSLFDEEPAPMGGASRWNEGKIHLGYLYAADPTLNTARMMLDGGLAFMPLIEELIGGSVAGHTTDADDIYLIQRDSVVDPDSAGAYFDAVSDLVRAHPDAGSYLTDASAASAEALSVRELALLGDPDTIVGGYRVPERSVQTRWVADRLCEALDAASAHVTLRMGVRVTAAEPVGGAWRIRDESGGEEQFDVVVNALWHGRPKIDVTAGLPPEDSLSHRYRVSVFARTTRPVSVPSMVIGVGPFGDIKNYNGRDFYLSWYPDGLLSESQGVEPLPPPAMTEHQRQQTAVTMVSHLAKLLPPVGEVLDAAESLRLGGGFVFARGKGSLSDPASTLHRRDRFGVRRMDGYFSVDTGKYSTAPRMARNLAAEIAAL
jgi:glycine/D-amino acid oxidase-like deaminating enzyme